MKGREKKSKVCSSTQSSVVGDIDNRMKRYCDDGDMINELID